MKVSIVGTPGSFAGNIGSIVEREATVRWLTRESDRQTNGAGRNLVRALAFGVGRGEHDKMLSAEEREQFEFLDKVASAVADLGTGKVSQSQAPAPAVPKLLIKQAKDTARMLEQLDESFAYYQGDACDGTPGPDEVVEIVKLARRAVSYGLALARTVEHAGVSGLDANPDAGKEAPQPAETPDHECG